MCYISDFTWQNESFAAISTTLLKLLSSVVLKSAREAWKCVFNFVSKKRCRVEEVGCKTEEKRCEIGRKLEKDFGLCEGIFCYHHKSERASSLLEAEEPATVM